MVYHTNMILCVVIQKENWSVHQGTSFGIVSRRFQQTTKFSGSSFWHQYFDCLSIEINTWCRHSIWKMISASRRIFWHGFQPFLKNYRFSASVFLAVCHRFSNGNKLWNMLQAAFDHEESFFETPKGWRPPSQWVFDVIQFKIIYSSKKDSKFRPEQKYVVFHSEFQSEVHFD